VRLAGDCEARDLAVAIMIEPMQKTSVSARARLNAQEDKPSRMPKAQLVDEPLRLGKVAGEQSRQRRGDANRSHLVSRIDAGTGTRSRRRLRGVVVVVAEEEVGSSCPDQLAAGRGHFAARELGTPVSGSAAH